MHTQTEQPCGAATGPTGPAGTSGATGPTGPGGATGPTGPGANLVAQVFRYSFTGGDGATVVINAARGFVGRASVNYNVQATMGVNAGGVGIQSMDPATFTISQFQVALTAPPTAGDSIMFTVENLT